MIFLAYFLTNSYSSTFRFAELCRDSNFMCHAAGMSSTKAAQFRAVPPAVCSVALAHVSLCYPLLETKRILLVFFLRLVYPLLFAFTFLPPVSSSSAHPILLLFLLLLLLLVLSRYLDSDSNDGDTGKGIVYLFYFFLLLHRSSFFFCVHFQISVFSLLLVQYIYFIVILIIMGVTQVWVCILFHVLFQTIVLSQNQEHSTSIPI